MMEKIWLVVRDVADRLHIGCRMARRFIEDNHLPYLELPTGQILVDADVVKEFADHIGERSWPVSGYSDEQPQA